MQLMTPVEITKAIMDVQHLLEWGRVRAVFVNEDGTPEEFTGLVATMCPWESGAYMMLDNGEQHRQVDYQGRIAKIEPVIELEDRIRLRLLLGYRASEVIVLDRKGGPGLIADKVGPMVWGEDSDPTRLYGVGLRTVPRDQLVTWIREAGATRCLVTGGNGVAHQLIFCSDPEHVEAFLNRKEVVIKTTYVLYDLESGSEISGRFRISL